jgi:hypothetical protein
MSFFTQNQNPEKETTNQNPETFDTKIKKFVEKNHPNLYILTPSYGGSVFVNYMCSLIQTIDLCNKLGVKIHVEFCKNDSLVSRARNNLVAKAMYDKEMTHIMFIDSDISWDAMDVFKLLLSEKELIGGIYPLKHYYWEKLLPFTSNSTEFTEKSKINPLEKWLDKYDNNPKLQAIVDKNTFLQHQLLKYNFNHHSNYLTVYENRMEVRHLATGFMMIQRTVIEKMTKAFPSTKYIDDVSFLQGDENNYAYALFDCGVEDGHYYSEDWLFCKRWKNMNGTIFADISISLTHTGIEDFKGSFLSTIL